MRTHFRRFRCEFPRMKRLGSFGRAFSFLIIPISCAGPMFLNDAGTDRFLHTNGPVRRVLPIDQMPIFPPLWMIQRAGHLLAMPGVR